MRAAVAAKGSALLARNGAAKSTTAAGISTATRTTASRAPSLAALGTLPSTAAARQSLAIVAPSSLRAASDASGQPAVCAWSDAAVPTSHTTACATKPNAATADSALATGRAAV